MNNIEQKSSTPAEMTPKSELEIFRDTIKEIKEEEMTKKKAWEARDMEGEAYNPHFDLINSEYLEEAEREVYEKYQSDHLTVEKFRTLRSAAMKDYEKLPAGAEKDAIGDFWAYIGNLVTAREDRRELEELKRKNK